MEGEPKAAQLDWQNMVASIQGKLISYFYSPYVLH
jgi:hypothetical protein